MQYAKEDAILLHPGPVNRGVELTTELIDGEQSLIHEQVKNGVAVRMAIIDLLMERRKKDEVTDTKWPASGSLVQDGWEKRYIG